jgi:hypothetical protein
MTRGEITFLFHKEEGTAIQASCFANFADPRDQGDVQESVLEILYDFVEEKLEQFKCITAVVDIPELDFYYTAMFVPGEEGNAVWEQMHEGNETIH